MYTLPLQYPMVNYTHAESPIIIFRASCNSIVHFLGITHILRIEGRVILEQVKNKWKMGIR